MRQELEPRIAAAGGVPVYPRRDDTAGGYTYPGMARPRDWATTDVAKATHFYSCAFCGQRFKGPHAVYTHIALRHTRKTLTGGVRGRRLSPERLATPVDGGKLEVDA